MTDDKYHELAKRLFHEAFSPYIKPAHVHSDDEKADRENWPQQKILIIANIVREFVGHSDNLPRG